MTLPSDPMKWAVTSFRDDRSKLYPIYDDYLAGDHPLVFATERFEGAFGRIFRAFAYNRAPVVIDAHADRLQVAGFGANDPTIAQAAKDLWDMNRMDVREGHVSFDAFAFGDAYVIVEMHPTRGKVALWTQPAKNVRVHYSDEWPGEIDLAVKAWQTDESYTRLNLYFADRIEKYISRTKTYSGVPSTPLAFERYETAGESWPLPLLMPGTVPVFHFANNGRTDTYGVSELRPIIPLQDALNKTLMDKMVAMEFAAYPQRVIIGLDVPDEKMMADLSRFQAGLDRIMYLTSERARVDEFSAVNIAQYISVAEFWDKTISRTSKVPVHYLSMSSDFPSGRALRIAEAPFIAKLTDRARAFGAVWEQVVEYSLRLQGMPALPDGAIRVNWQSVAPMSAEDEWELALLKVNTGMPFTSALREIGYEPEQIQLIMEEAQQSANLAMRAFDAGVVPPAMADDRELGGLAG